MQNNLEIMITNLSKRVNEIEKKMDGHFQARIDSGLNDQIVAEYNFHTDMIIDCKEKIGLYKPQLRSAIVKYAKLSACTTSEG